MSKKRDISLDPSKFLSHSSIQVNLVNASLYLSAYEILKTSLIECTKNTIIGRVDSEDRKGLVQSESNINNDSHGALLGRPGNEEPSQRAIDEYQRILKIEYERRAETGLIPSTKWLRSEGVLDAEAIKQVYEIRNHRNEIAHELPSIIVGRDFELNLDYLEDIEKILNRVEIWRFLESYSSSPKMKKSVAQMNLEINEVRPVRMIIFDQFMSAVRALLEQIIASLDD